MSMSIWLQKIKSYDIVQLLLNWRREYLGKRILKNWSDEDYIIKKYTEAFGVKPDLVEPKTFNEKLQWIKLYGVTDDMCICADKYCVRDYLQNKGYGYLLNPYIAVVRSPDEIIWEDLPKKFVLKASHGSGWNIFCTDKSQIGKVKRNIWMSSMKSWMRQNLYAYGREPVYKAIIPRIVCEQFIESDGELLDYKFFCINGKIEFIQVTINEKHAHKINLYSTEWKRIPANYAYPPSNKDIPCPLHFEEMKIIAEDISRPFDFSRIDLYSVSSGIIFGEITFFPSSGFKHFTPEAFDLELGKKLILHND